MRINRSSRPSRFWPCITTSSCRRQFAKYTCPTCNTPYCSLTCFRSQVRFCSNKFLILRTIDFRKAHTQCSETFYKKEIESEIHAEPSKNAQERQRMMDLLKKFEEESVVDQTLLEDEDPSDLVRRFGAVDLGMCFLTLGSFTLIYTLDYRFYQSWRALGYVNFSRAVKIYHSFQ